VRVEEEPRPLLSHCSHRQIWLLFAMKQLPCHHFKGFALLVHGVLHGEIGSINLGISFLVHSEVMLIWHLQIVILSITYQRKGPRGSVVDEALCYKPGR
jgi:hypothetical protein